MSNSIHTAHVASMITAFTGNSDYDDAADTAAALLAQNPGLRDTAALFDAGQQDEETLRTAVLSAFYDAALATWRGTCHHPDNRQTHGPFQDGCPACEAYLDASETFTASITRPDAAEETERNGGSYWDTPFLAARCTSCGQEFNPLDTGDLIHLSAAVPGGPVHYCGGRGEMLGMTEAAGA